MIELGVVVGANGNSGAGVSRNEICSCDDCAGVSGVRISRVASGMMELGVVVVALGSCGSGVCRNS